MSTPDFLPAPKIDMETSESKLDHHVLTFIHYTYSVTKKVSKYCLGPARERLFKPYLITPPHFLSTDQTAKFNTSRMYVVKLDSFWTDKIGMDWRYKKSVVVAIKRDIRRSGYQTWICYAFVSKLFIL